MNNCFVLATVIHVSRERLSLVTDDDLTVQWLRPQGLQSGFECWRSWKNVFVSLYLSLPPIIRDNPFPMLILMKWNEMKALAWSLLPWSSLMYGYGHSHTGARAQKQVSVSRVLTVCCLAHSRCSMCTLRSASLESLFTTSSLGHLWIICGRMQRERLLSFGVLAINDGQVGWYLYNSRNTASELLVQGHAWPCLIYFTVMRTTVIYLP